MSSRFIEPDPEPDPDIDRILPHGVPRATDRYLPAAQRAGVRWAAAAFALAFSGGLVGWWWANRAAPLDLPPTSAGPATAPPVSATEAMPEPAPMAAVPAPAPARVGPPVSTRAPPPAPLRLPPPNAPAVAGPSTSVKASPASPRDVCAGRSQFSLYRCMQTQCELRAWTDHPLCVRLRATDSVE